MTQNVTSHTLTINFKLRGTGADEEFLIDSVNSEKDPTVTINMLYDAIARVSDTILNQMVYLTLTNDEEHFDTIPLGVARLIKDIGEANKTLMSYVEKKANLILQLHDLVQLENNPDK